jgi:hypothetical protein
MKGNPHRNEKGNMLDEFVIIEVGESSRVARQIDEGLQSVVSSDLQQQKTFKNWVFPQPLPPLNIDIVYIRDPLCKGT